MTLCTWDYLPNNWFPEPADEALDDISRHGVNVFPRPGCMPKAKANAAGTLDMDWTALDE